MMKSSVSQRASFRLICVGLALLSLAVYSRLLTCDFIDFDDPDYVTENQHVLDGLTLNGFAWAFRSTHAVNGTPLPWIWKWAVGRGNGLSRGAITSAACCCTWPTRFCYLASCAGSRARSGAARWWRRFLPGTRCTWNQSPGCPSARTS